MCESSSKKLGILVNQRQEATFFGIFCLVANCYAFMMFKRLV
jgi:hypothetical protein